VVFCRIFCVGSGGSPFSAVGRNFAVRHESDVSTLMRSGRVSYTLWLTFFGRNDVVRGSTTMTMDKSLRVRRGLIRARGVLTRAERIARLQEGDRWKEDQSPLGLPKVRVFKLAVKKKKKKKEEEEGAAAPAGGAAAPAAKPAAKGK
jgi:small basic protein (TIGR04137 family)